jgi:hypothetical protein
VWRIAGLCRKPVIRHTQLYFPYISEENPEVAERLRRLRFSAELGIAASALKTCATLSIEDAQTDRAFITGSTG